MFLVPSVLGEAILSSMYQLKVTLADVKPPVWRRIRVRGDLSLERLHVVLQRTLGWRDEHLHEWIVDGRRYGIPEPDEPEYEVEDERRLTLREAGPIPGARFEYVYDLGDGWRHHVMVEKIDLPDPALRHPSAWLASAHAPRRTAAAHPATRSSWRPSTIPAIPNTRSG
jgi:Plasmid pRiA4b ORF-3-like protein